ncbi:unnamed protein product [Menidia menidia]|uniref:(Atlantic silverside) hypothetical protein n=1 Tax=Menidia menidia TaxID=238744 RepID=A0A8S4BE87_9TELE|nr:unnamed protein product [Menidia menidia]
MAADVYIDAMLSHPVFKMEKEDFKISDGSTECFTDLRVGVYKEIVPMGVDPDIISYKLAGVHLEPEEFHREVEAVLANGDSDTVLLDCRNFYERVHLEPEEFHREVEAVLANGDSDTVLLDCRNFYESKIVSSYLLFNNYSQSSLSIKDQIPTEQTTFRWC